MWRASALRRGIVRASSMVCAAELAHQHAAIVGGRVQIVARVELGGKVAASASSLALVEVAHDRPVRNAANREPHILLRRNRRAGHDGEIAMAARELAEREAFARATAGK